MGSATDAKLHKISFDTYQDDGSDIRSEFVSGVYGNPLVQTNCNNLFMDVRRGDGKTGALTTAPKAFVQTRDNGEVSWSSQYEVDLGKQGQTAKQSLQRTRGKYLTRQYRVRHQDNSPFVLNGIWEDIIK